MGPGPSVPPRSPRTGVQYVTGAPPQSPVLRPHRIRMYDREQVWGGVSRIQFFTDNRHTADGRDKDATFTNMTQSGQLGYPLEMDVVSISISPVSSDEEYAKVYERFINSDYVFRWYFGSNTLWFEQPISLMRVRTSQTDVYFDEERKRAYRLGIKDGKVVAIDLGDAIAPLFGPVLEPRLMTRFVDLTTHKKEARRVQSTESFHAEIMHPNSPGGGSIDVYVCMDGILYRPL